MVGAVEIVLLFSRRFYSEEVPQERECVDAWYHLLHAHSPGIPKALPINRVFYTRKSKKSLRQINCHLAVYAGDFLRQLKVYSSTFR